MSIVPPDARSSLEVTIAGEGPERYRLETMVRELDLNARFHLPGVVSSDQMNRLYRDSDLFVHTSMAEGLSNALLEAMASGLPCLCAEPTGFEDLDGAVIPVGSAGKLATNILSMMASPESYAEFSFASLAAASHYTWESVANRYIELLNGLGKRS
jgi:glycosyltransferase involved in cell wall biosynthesis